MRCLELNTNFKLYHTSRIMMWLSYTKLGLIVGEGLICRLFEVVYTQLGSQFLQTTTTKGKDLETQGMCFRMPQKCTFVVHVQEQDRMILFSSKAHPTSYTDWGHQLSTVTTTDLRYSQTLGNNPFTCNFSQLDQRLSKWQKLKSR